MEYLELFAWIVAIGLAITWLIFYKDKDLALQYGFFSDVNDYLQSIEEETSIEVLNGLESSLRIFRSLYKDDIKPRVLDEACGNIQAAIKNRKQQLTRINEFLTAKLKELEMPAEISLS